MATTRSATTTWNGSLLEGKGRVELLDGARVAPSGVRKTTSRVVRAVDDGDGAEAVAHERVRGERTHRAGTDDDGAHPREVTEHVARQFECPLDERAADRVDAGLGVHALADAQRLLHQAAHDGADTARFLTFAQAVAHLAEDLALSDGERVEAGRDVEQVRDGALVEVDVEVVAQVGHRHAGDVGEGVAEFGDGTVERRGVGVDLDAVARRQHDGLGEVLALAEALAQVGLALGVERGLLEHGERGRAVGKPQNNDAQTMSSFISRSPCGPRAFCSRNARI